MQGAATTAGNKVIVKQIAQIEKRGDATNAVRQVIWPATVLLRMRMAVDPGVGWAEEAAVSAEDGAGLSVTNAKVTDTSLVTAPLPTDAIKLVLNVTTRATSLGTAQTRRSSVTNAAKWVTWRETVLKNSTINFPQLTPFRRRQRREFIKAMGGKGERQNWPSGCKKRLKCKDIWCTVLLGECGHVVFQNGKEPRCRTATCLIFLAFWSRWAVYISRWIYAFVVACCFEYVESVRLHMV